MSINAKHDFNMYLSITGNNRVIADVHFHHLLNLNACQILCLTAERILIQLLNECIIFVYWIKTDSKEDREYHSHYEITQPIEAMKGLVSVEKISK